MAAGEIRVLGLRELQRDLRLLDKELSKSLRDDLKEAAEPVRERAQALAPQRISHLGSKWSGMKIGVTARTVYVASSARRAGGSPRPNLGRLLVKQAMLPALEEKSGEIVRHVERLLDRLASRNGF